MQALAGIMEEESTDVNSTQREEMALGISSLKFQYLHTLIFLLKGDESSSGWRTSSAREALKLLPSIVSNWSSVYNGVVW